MDRMPQSPYIQELISYKHKIVKKLASSKEVVGLLLDDPNIDMESDAAYEVVGEKIFDYNYVDKTVQRDDAYIMVESEMDGPVSGTINQWFIYVQVVSSKRYNTLKGKKFKGVSGNRRDNLCLQIDSLLNGERSFGIGELELYDVSIATVPDTFTSMMLTYRVNDYRRDRIPRG